MLNRPSKGTVEHIAPGETLGRDERSGTKAKRSMRKLNAHGKANAPVGRFVPPKHTNELSVNRMAMAPKDKLAEIGVTNAELSGKSFWGWYILSTEDIMIAGCTTIATPLDSNPYHADIIIPVSLDDDDRRHAITEYARQLAYRAQFVPWGDWSIDLQ